MRVNALLVAVIGVLATAACAGVAQSPESRVVPENASAIRSVLQGRGIQPASGTSQYIQHVVVIIQENRSFDNFFATFPGADGATEGLMKLPSGDVYQPLVPSDLKQDSLGHQHFSFLKEYDGGKMDGFNLVDRAFRRGRKEPAGTYAYRYTKPTAIKPYWSIAQQYVLADHMFTTQGSSSFTAHQDLIAGGTPIGADDVIDFPSPSTWGCNGPPGTVTNLIDPYGNYLRGKGPFPCFTYETIRDLLDGDGLSWLYFTNPAHSAFWDAFDAISAVRNGPEWTSNIITPETNIFQYISYGQLPAVTWVIPDTPTSDHPGPHGDMGPDWVASVVNAIGESGYWPTTAIIVLWDEWGGEYDNVPPPQLDGQGLGPRIPLMIISPYARESYPSQPGYISHTQYEDGSILKFIEQNWNLGSLGTTDVRANSIIDSFDFTQAPRQFLPIVSQNPAHNVNFFRYHYKAASTPIDEY